MYVQQNAELIPNILMSLIMMSKQANIQVFISLRKASIRIPRSSICFSTTFCMQVIEATNLFSTRKPPSKLYKFLPTRYFEKDFFNGS